MYKYIQMQMWKNHFKRKDFACIFVKCLLFFKLVKEKIREILISEMNQLKNKKIIKWYWASILHKDNSNLNRNDLITSFLIW